MTEEQAEVIARNLVAINAMMIALVNELRHVTVMQKYLSKQPREDREQENTH